MTSWVSENSGLAARDAGRQRRFSFRRPPGPEGVIFGLIFRVAIMIAAIIVPLAITFPIAFLLGAPRGWAVLAPFSAFFILSILSGEYIKTKVYELLFANADKDAAVDLTYDPEAVSSRRLKWSIHAKETSKIEHSIELGASTEPSAIGIRVVRRVFDVVLAAIMLGALSPVLLAFAIAIRAESPGPIFFAQMRIGLNGRAFRIWKFRTMVSAEDALVGGAARITRVGQVARRLSIDELPQLFNVLRGEMTFVGPRPLPVFYEEALEKSGEKALLNALHEYRPGIISPSFGGGRASAPSEVSARISADVEYARSATPVRDLWVIAKAVVWSFRNVERY